MENVYEFGELAMEKEIYKISKNPFEFQGVMGRAAFFLTLFTYSIIQTAALFLFCPHGIKKLVKNVSPLESFLETAPMIETVSYVLITLVFSLLVFIIYKKRLLDILGKEKNALKASVIFALVIFIMNIQSNILAATGSVSTMITSYGVILVTLFLYFKKGKITGDKSVELTQEVDETQAE